MTEGPDMIEESSADSLTARDSHGSAVRLVRPLRGRAFVRVLDDSPSSIILRPEAFRNPREEKIHRGRILWLGPPARLEDRPGSPEVPWDCEVGDEVYFTYAVWLERMRVMSLAGIDEDVAVVQQGEIQAVIS